MVVGGDEWGLGERDEGGVDDDFHMREAYSCQGVRSKDRDEARKDALVESDHDLPAPSNARSGRRGGRGETARRRWAFGGVSVG